jgi:hypothetical protein
MPNNWAFRERKILSYPEQYRRWGWAALQGGHIRVARRHAVWALRHAPMSMETWRFVACALRGR